MFHRETDIYLMEKHLVVAGWRTIAHTSFFTSCKIKSACCLLAFECQSLAALCSEGSYMYSQLSSVELAPIPTAIHLGCDRCHELIPVIVVSMAISHTDYVCVHME